VTELMKGIIFDIKRFAIHDGPGIRTTVFLKGCPMDCHWCHNPESRSPELQKTTDNEEIGRYITVADVIQEIEKEIIFYDQSGGGVTFSGGEPLQQTDFLSALLDQCRKRDIHTTLDTTGYAVTELFSPIIPRVDLFLYDLKIMDEEDHMKYTGVGNRSVKENLKRLEAEDKAVILRFPVIPGITDSEANIKAIGEFVTPMKNVQQIDLLPYHRIAEAKYRRLDMIYRMDGVLPPNDERMEEVKQLFENYSENMYINKE
jgi:pyruvate formate lyase activating enzyme